VSTVSVIHSVYQTLMFGPVDNSAMPSICHGKLWLLSGCGHGIQWWIWMSSEFQCTVL